MATKDKTKKNRGGRRSKAEGMTEAKANAAETRKVEAQPELGLVINDDDFTLHLTSIRRATEGQKKTKSAYDAACKAAKKVSPELLACIKQALKDEHADPDDIRRELELRGIALKKIGSTLQLTLHDSLLGNEHALVERRAFAQGKDGKPLDIPYPKDSDLAKLWQQKWLEGQAAIVSGAGGAADETVDPGVGHNSANAETETDEPDYETESEDENELEDA